MRVLRSKLGQVEAGRAYEVVHLPVEMTAPRDMAPHRGEPMLPALGLDSTMGRTLAAAAVGAGSMAICHVNDPFFWIAAHMGRLSPGRALSVISLGSAVMAIGALVVIATIRQFI